MHGPVWRMKIQDKEQHELYNREVPRHVMEDILSTREMQIYDLRWQGHTYEELGQIYGLSKERIRQIYSKALSKLRKKYLFIVKVVRPGMNERFESEARQQLGGYYGRTK